MQSAASITVTWPLTRRLHMSILLLSAACMCAPTLLRLFALSPARTYSGDTATLAVPHVWNIITSNFFDVHLLRLLITLPLLTGIVNEVCHFLNPHTTLQFLLFTAASCGAATFAFKAVAWTITLDEELFFDPSASLLGLLGAAIVAFTQAHLPAAVNRGTGLLPLPGTKSQSSPPTPVPAPPWIVYVPKVTFSPYHAATDTLDSVGAYMGPATTGKDGSTGGMRSHDIAVPARGDAASGTVQCSTVEGDTTTTGGGGVADVVSGTVNGEAYSIDDRAAANGGAPSLQSSTGARGENEISELLASSSVVQSVVHSVVSVWDDVYCYVMTTVRRLVPFRVELLAVDIARFSRVLQGRLCAATTWRGDANVVDGMPAGSRVQGKHRGATLGRASDGAREYGLSRASSLSTYSESDPHAAPDIARCIGHLPSMYSATVILLYVWGWVVRRVLVPVPTAASSAHRSGFVTVPLIDEPRRPHHEGDAAALALEMQAAAVDADADADAAALGVDADALGVDAQAAALDVDAQAAALDVDAQAAALDVDAQAAALDVDADAAALGVAAQAASLRVDAQAAAINVDSVIDSLGAAPLDISGVINELLLIGGQSNYMDRGNGLRRLEEHDIDNALIQQQAPSLYNNTFLYGASSAGGGGGSMLPSGSSGMFVGGGGRMFRSMVLSSTRLVAATDCCTAIAGCIFGWLYLRRFAYYDPIGQRGDPSEEFRISILLPRPLRPVLTFISLYCRKIVKIVLRRLGIAKSSHRNRWGTYDDDDGDDYDVASGPQQMGDSRTGRASRTPIAPRIRNFQDFSGLYSMTGFPNVSRSTGLEVGKDESSVFMEKSRRAKGLEMVELQLRKERKETALPDR